MQSISFVFVVCSECGAEVDRIEYDDASVSPAVAAVASALGLDDDAAARLVKRNNPGAERTSEQNARELAQSIVDNSVEQRPADASQCPLGHDAPLAVSDDNPTPAVAVHIAKGAAR